MNIKKKEPFSEFHLSHLHKAVSLSPSLFITFIHYVPYQVVVFTQGHSCSVPPGIVTPLTHSPTGPTYGGATMLHVVWERKLNFNLAHYWGICSKFP